MKNIIFICEGNICRSPSAEFILQYLLKQEHIEDEYNVTSRATISQTQGEDTYYLAKRQLALHHIPYQKREAKPITITEYNQADYVIGMDNYNLVLLKRMIFIRSTSKLHLLLDFTDEPREISDPYYTRDFVKAYDDVYKGCLGFVKYLKENK